ncbi:MAG: branched-chain-amino-acid transaminase [Deltaproteobacteria bacterium]|nr:branched-chain-amino-acid transaminase [Deltaproteobacteria bacterium]
MLEDRTIYRNGEFIKWNEATVHVMSHSFGRGSAIFEVLSVHDTEMGPVLFRLDEHMERLLRSASFLHMELPLSPQALQDAVLETVKRNGIRAGFVKILCFYPQIAFEILPPQKMLDVSIFAIDPAQDLGGLKFPVEQGTSLCVSSWRKLDPQTVPIEAKAAANYLNGIMARMEARERGFENVVMLDTQGFIAEGGTESIFLVRDGRLLTPAAGTVLLSISRKSVLEASSVVGIEAVESRLPPERLFEADEIFLSGTPIKVLPVRRIESREIDGVPGPVTGRLLALMSEIVSGRDERFTHWLFPLKST